MPSLVERATTSMLVSPDWTINIEICDMCARDPELAKEAVTLIKKRLKEKPELSAVYALHLLEALMKNSWYAIPHVHQREYLSSLSRIVKDKKTKYQVRTKLAELIQSWGIGFQSSTRFPDFFMTYQSLRHAGVTFLPAQNDYTEPPMPSELRTRRTTASAAATAAAARPIQQQPATSPGSTRRVYVDQYGNRFVASSQAPARQHSTTPTSTRSIAASGGAPPHETKSERTARIRKQLEPIRNKFQLLEDMLTCTEPEDLPGNELVAELFPSCLQYHEDVMRWVQRGNVDDLLMGELLSLNDQMTSIQQRYEDLQSIASRPRQQHISPVALLLDDVDTDSPTPARLSDFDAVDMRLPPPPGTRAPPLLLDTDFVSRPISSVTSPSHQIVPLDSLEAFLSRPPVSSPSPSSSSSISPSSYAFPSSPPASLSTGSPSYFELPTQSPLPLSSPVLLTSSSPSVSPPPLAGLQMPLFTGYPASTPIETHTHGSIPQGVSLTSFFGQQTPVQGVSSPYLTGSTPPPPSPAPLFSHSSSSPASTSFFDLPASSPSSFQQPPPTTATPPSFFELSSTSQQQQPSLVSNINPWENSSAAVTPGQPNFNPFNL